jgi:hypothetical protein
MSSEKEKYQRRLTILGVAGTPFYAAFALGSAAHFKGNAIFSLLENPDTAFTVFLVGAVGAAVDIGLAVYTTSKIKALDNEST